MNISKRMLIAAVTAWSLAWAVLLILGASVIGHASAPVAPPAISFEDEQRALGREPFGDVDDHMDCWAQIGETSYIECRDGYMTSS
ncbi:hypothetical protein OG599_09075 [Streptomyces sp. NBC_01335]|uniref:hypothetical protein n=1 Tax=Streptomyces sp. NBC_01335 TaxID=2903828 RepID=UPI002E106315|nr:hypothetical protein OG599_09075 [Streptomyces sp. NBC_01335]